ncbi:hypothetical protein [uncultured Bradyrhizobium sp.]|uniref:hypothetical protein n=1 Tax=uncultured Bradyrhizobium sp. TaxID=199684 RepID=UPI0035CA8C81
MNKTIISIKLGAWEQAQPRCVETASAAIARFFQGFDVIAQADSRKAMPPVELSRHRAGGFERSDDELDNPNPK